MWIVVDWHDTKFIGPFPTKDAAEDWLATKGVLLGQYDENEVGVYQIEHEGNATLSGIGGSDAK